MYSDPNLSWLGFSCVDSIEVWQQSSKPWCFTRPSSYLIHTLHATSNATCQGTSHDIGRAEGTAESLCCLRLLLSSLVSLVQRNGASLYHYSLIQHHVARVLHSFHTVPISVFISSRLLGFALRNCTQLNNGTGKGSWSCFGLCQCKCSCSPIQRGVLTENNSVCFYQQSLTGWQNLFSPML